MRKSCRTPPSPALTPSPKVVTNPGPAWYGTTARPDGSQAFHAERETSPPDADDNTRPASAEAYNKVVIYWQEKADSAFSGRSFRTGTQWQRWPANVADYAHNTVYHTGSIAGTAEVPATGVQFAAAALPTLVFQDDLAQTEARIDTNSQRFLVNFAAGSDRLNRSLLKFTANGKVWYVRLYTQAENGQSKGLVDADGTSTVKLTGTASTAGLVPGMIVNGTGLPGVVTVVSITNSTQLVLSQTLATGTRALAFLPPSLMAPPSTPPPLSACGLILRQITKPRATSPRAATLATATIQTFISTPSPSGWRPPRQAPLSP